MADNDFRSYRARGPGAPARSQPDDPLAELARLIGQSEPATERDGDAPAGPAFDQPAGGLDWAAEDRYAQQNEPAEADYDAPDERYAPAQHADLLPTFHPGAPSYEDAHEPPVPRPFSPPMRSLNGGRDALPERARFHDEQAPVQSAGRQPPGFLSQLPDDHDYDYPPEQREDDQAYALEDYEEEAPAGRRRSGLVVVAAVLGLAVLGTAGAFAYRAMFGSSMLPSLPPIIRADDGPNKIVPNKPKSSASDQADASATSGEKLVSREEQPVDVPAPANSAPRVVSTIPIFPDPNSGQPGVPSSAQGAALATGGSAFPAPASAPPPAPVQTSTAPAAPAGSIWPPSQSTAPASAGGPPSVGPGGTPSPAPKKVHTVIIRTDQMGSTTADASTAPETPSGAPAPAAARTAPSRAAMQQARPAPRRERRPMARCRSFPIRMAAAPAPARVRTALARPAELSSAERAEAAPSAGSGGYAVQVTSQRSEADAQAEFRTLRSKFPAQFGGREPIIRRADLGAKGVYYRALVGPFASADQAAGMCSSLKAAGGSCIVQRN